MSQKTVITCALTGSADTAGKSDAVPVTPKQIADAALEARKAGAAVVHIHVRDPETGKASMDLELYRETVGRIRDSGSDVVINLTTGPGGSFIPGDVEPIAFDAGTNMKTPDVRMQHIADLLPDICTLDVATLNFGERAMVNVPKHLRAMADRAKELGVKPELEVFDSGHVLLAKQLIKEGHLESPALFQLCLGIPWGAPATPESMAFMKSLLPEDAIWSGFGISRTEFPMVAQAAMLGGHTRVGLEDNLYMARGELAKNNGQLVERAVQIIENIGGEVADPSEARAAFKLGSNA
ncbi:3-keto-5-aminohexanoate cleavage protein [Nisaea acidiphila]|uniref:3-keto-5-aminohexanoate cleavage protein n=1 Tax=Nisaea acidiphila TaxID=1862145 RepID=A0A9J7ATE0_9PROT|nr:3-keto-5-aminohexanoate cleavage protein [Nisaea acidiphila]UUX50600.1 3-keto-5-aminohexanoate cleavage protein [Nisaea acidiphila]